MTVATSEEITATESVQESASRMASLSMSSSYQRNVKPSHVARDFEALKEKTIRIKIGR